MYELTVESVFSAAHAIVIRGVREPLHGHDWRVTVGVQGAVLDDDGLLVDFHAIEDALRDVTEPFRNTNLNEVPPFDRVNPSAENVAAYIARVLVSRLKADNDDPDEAPKQARIAWVRVTEAPGCAVTFRFD